MADTLEAIKTFKLVVPINRPIHVADDKEFTGTDLACIAKLVTAANRGGLQGLKIQSLRVRCGEDGEVSFEFSWEK